MPQTAKLFTNGRSQTMRIQLADLPLIDHLRVAKQLYGPLFAPELTLKSLCHFADGNLHGLPGTVRQRLLGAVRRIRLEDLP